MVKSDAINHRRAVAKAEPKYLLFSLFHGILNLIKWTFLGCLGSIVIVGGLLIVLSMVLTWDLEFLVLSGDTSIERDILRIATIPIILIRQVLGIPPSGVSFSPFLTLAGYAVVILCSLSTLVAVVDLLCSFVYSWRELRKIKRLSMKFPDETAIAEVASHLDDSSEYTYVACAAADALGFAGPGAVESLITFLRERRVEPPPRSSPEAPYNPFPEYRPAGRAALSLARIGDERGAWAISSAIAWSESVWDTPRSRKRKVEAFRATLRQAQAIIKDANPDPVRYDG